MFTTQGNGWTSDRYISQWPVIPLDDLEESGELSRRLDAMETPGLVNDDGMRGNLQRVVSIKTECAEIYLPALSLLYGESEHYTTHGTTRRQTHQFRFMVVSYDVPTVNDHYRRTQLEPSILFTFDRKGKTAAFASFVLVSGFGPAINKWSRNKREASNEIVHRARNAARKTLVRGMGKK